ncbi:hypothetical protein D9753_05040 [Streptomyces dangxiongensis]|uniref:Glucose-methanol-choline oxidoreductase C-terminal domain-containing protein n=1 Tax=Streptomyces dangxiongensis TaxID=1442032 RepID=A0A3G2J824_9ACTN|nr:hypothetical protein D9753_05040 [Streptomyces dangxiongensis]
MRVWPRETRWATASVIAARSSGELNGACTSAEKPSITGCLRAPGAHGRPEQGAGGQGVGRGTVRQPHADPGGQRVLPGRGLGSASAAHGRPAAVRLAAARPVGGRYLRVPDEAGLPRPRPAPLGRSPGASRDRPRLPDGSRRPRHPVVRAWPEKVRELAAAMKPLADPSDGTPVQELSDTDLRGRVGTYWHPVGTCAMGPAEDLRSVTDGQGAVHGVAGLRVADASVLPTVPAANTQLPVLAVAEMLADILRARPPRPHPHSPRRPPWRQRPTYARTSWSTAAWDSAAAGTPSRTHARTSSTPRPRSNRLWPPASRPSTGVNRLVADLARRKGTSCGSPHAAPHCPDRSRRTPACPGPSAVSPR